MKRHVALSAIALIVLVNGEKIDTPIPCGETSDCTDITNLPRNAFCKDGYCMCPNEAKNCSSLDASVHKTRVPGPLVYRKCKIEQDCIFEGGFCNHVIKQCDCIKGHVPSSNGQHCVPALRSIDANCIDKNQCLSFLPNSTCRDNRCTCVPGYHYVNNTCWRRVEFGQPCTRNEDCSHIEGAVCTNERKCGCEADNVLNNYGTKCLVAAKKIRDQCVDMAQCTFEHSICVNNVCYCEPNYHYENDMMRCFPNKGLGDDCENDYECYQIEDYINNLSFKSLKCEANRCTCADYYVRDNNKCVNSASSHAVSFLLAFLSAIALARNALRS